MLTKKEGLILYWCEGDKYTSKGRYKVAVTSADPQLLQLFVKWLERYYNTPIEEMKARVQIWDQSKEMLAIEWWSKQIGIPVRNFIKSNIKQVGGRKKKHKFGICRVYIDSKDVLFRILDDIQKEFGASILF